MALLINEDSSHEQRLLAKYMKQLSYEFNQNFANCWILGNWFTNLYLINEAKLHLD